MEFALQMVCDRLTSRCRLFSHEHAVDHPVAARKAKQEAAEPLRPFAGVDEQPVHGSKAHNGLCDLDRVLIEKS